MEKELKETVGGGGTDLAGGNLERMTMAIRVGGES